MQYAGFVADLKRTVTWKGMFDLCIAIVAILSILSFYAEIN